MEDLSLNDGTCDIGLLDLGMPKNLGLASSFFFIFKPYLQNL